MPSETLAEKRNTPAAIGDRFAILRACRRIWAIASVHGEFERLASLHGKLEPALTHGDRIVYLGNLLGRGESVRQSIDELLRFRREILARVGMFAADLVYLRGNQEEMWHKLLQVQFAPNPRQVLEWMRAQGAEATIRAYSGGIESGLIAAREGPRVLGRWTSSLRDAQSACPGHVALMSALKRAAFTDDGQLLFVNAGIDPTRPLSAQSDSFWWGAGAFGRINEPYAGYRRVVRGFDTAHAGLVEGPFTVSLDAGSGFGGPLLAACLAPDGTILDRIEA